MKATMEETESWKEEKIRDMFYGAVQSILDEKLMIGDHPYGHFHSGVHCRCLAEEPDGYYQHALDSTETESRIDSHWHRDVE